MAALRPRKVWQAMQLRPFVPARSRPTLWGFAASGTRSNFADGNTSSCFSHATSGSVFAAPNFGIRVFIAGRTPVPLATTSRSAAALSFAPTPVSGGGMRPWSPRLSSRPVKYSLRVLATPPSPSRWWHAMQFSRVSVSCTIAADDHVLPSSASAACTAARCVAESG